jgi:ubiquinone/menaquinone biosynthesis C-methylase UbiE
VLEHIPDYSRALSEFNRVLKPGGTAVVQTPYSRLLKNNLKMRGLMMDEWRLFFHGQGGLMYGLGYCQFLKSMRMLASVCKSKGMRITDASMAYLYGVNSKEDLILVHK